MKKIFSLLATILFAGSMMADSYVKVTAAPEDWSGEYIIATQVADSVVAWTGVDAAYCREKVTVVDNTIENYAGVTVTVAPIEGAANYSILVNGGTNNGKYISSGTSAPTFSNGLKFVTTAFGVDFALTNGVTTLSQTITGNADAAKNGTVYLIYNGTNNNERFRFYKETNFGNENYPNVILFKKAAGNTPEPVANLFDAATTTFESWFGDAGWAPISTSTAAWDATTGTITANINQDPYGQWHAQLKLQTTGIVLDPAKNYEFKATFLSTMTAGGITAKVFDNAELTMKGDIAVEANTPYAYTSAPFVGASIGNGVIVFDLGNCPNGAVVTISDIALVESNQEIVVPTEPKPTTAPAAPTADAATVLSVYSNTYPAASAVGYCEGWGQTTALEELNLDGNTVLYYKNFNYLGWGVANPIDASTCTGLHLDIWANGAGNINVWPIFGGAGLATDDSKYATVALVEGWNSVDLDFATNFAGLDLTSIFQFKFADLTTTDKVVAIDNVYFYGYVAPAVVYKSLAEVYNLAKNDVVDLKAFDVVYVNGSNIYVKDATAAGLLYANNYGLVAGDHVAAGLQGTVDIYNGIYEVKPTTAYTDLTVTAGEAPAPAVATAAPTAADQNKYVVYKDVTFNVADTLTNAAKTTAYGVFKGDTVVFYNNFMIAASFEAGKTYDVVAVNAMYKTAVQVYPIEITEHETISVECDGEHGLYNPATAAINATYLAPGWDPVIAGADHYAEMENGNIVLHVGAQGYGEMWNGQVFVDPGFTFEEGKAYHYEFDIISAGKVCVTVKVNDNDADEGAHIFFAKTLYDLNIGGGVYHFSTDSVFAKDGLNTARGPLVFGFGWTDADQDVIISCIKITEAGDAPEPVEEKMYMKHPWGTGANDDWTWKELEKTTFKNVKAWTITEAWGGVGFNIADNAEGKDASWYAAETIQFLDADGALVEAPAVGTAGCAFYFVPAFVGGITTPAYVVVPAAEGLLNATQNNAVKAIVNGNVVIIRNGVRYNLVGARF